MTSADLGLLLSLAALLALSAFFAGAETALTRISRHKALTLKEEGRRGATALLRLVDHPERFLNPVLLLMLLTHLVIATLVGIFAEHRFGSFGVAVATGLEVALVFVLAEAAPKTWAVQHPERSALFSAAPVDLLVRIPLVRWLTRGLIGMTNIILPGKGLKEGPFVSEAELLALADVAVEEDVIEHQERALIHSIIEFGDTVAREVMVPRPDMVAVEGRDKASDVLEVAMTSGFSRIPVYEQGIDDVSGMLYTRDLMRAMQTGSGAVEVRTLVREAHFVPETKRVAELLREMQREKWHIAIVVDEYGGTAGLVTLEDLIEELVGEITDEFDVEEPLVEALPDGAVRVSARMPLDQVNELLDADLPEGDWDTIGGLVFDLLGHVPAEGESVVCDGRRLTAQKVQGRRIGRVLIRRASEETPSPSS